jgi:hypothetical protein
MAVNANRFPRQVRAICSKGEDTYNPTENSEILGFQTLPIVRCPNTSILSIIHHRRNP